MARLNWLQRLYWRHLSQPVVNRALIRYVIETRVGSVLEIGIGSGKRMTTLLDLIQLPEGIPQLRYVGVDPFESSEADREHMKLKHAHRLLSEKGVKGHLIPGDAATALPRVAHSVLPSDLVVIDGQWGATNASGQALQHWIARLVVLGGAVFASQTEGAALTQVNLEQVQNRLKQAA